MDDFYDKFTEENRLKEQWVNRDWESPKNLPNHRTYETKEYRYLGSLYLRESASRYRSGYLRNYGLLVVMINMN